MDGTWLSLCAGTFSGKSSPCSSDFHVCTLGYPSNFVNSVESQGRTLEELEWVYQQPNPVKASQNLDKIVVQEDGTVTEKIETGA